jgi:hypothetical protein
LFWHDFRPSWRERILATSARPAVETIKLVAIPKIAGRSDFSRTQWVESPIAAFSKKEGIKSFRKR